MEALNPRVKFKESEEVKELRMWDKSVPGQGKSKCKDPEAGVYLMSNEQENPQGRASKAEDTWRGDCRQQKPNHKVLVDACRPLTKRSGELPKVFEKMEDIM